MTTLSLAFDQQFTDMVWQLAFEQVSDAPGLLVAELRDGDRKRLALEALELPQGERRNRWENALPWQSTVLGVWNGYLLYHRLENERLPVPTALGCFDLRTGQTTWEWPGHYLTNSDGSTVWARRTAVTEFDYAITRAFRLSTGENVENAINPPELHNSRIRFPVSYSEKSPYWPVINRFLKKLIDLPDLEHVDYLEAEDKIIFSYYIHEKKSPLRTFLLITDRQQTIWFHEPTQLRVDRDGPDFGGFCVWQNQLLAFTDPTRLISYYLNPTP